MQAQAALARSLTIVADWRYRFADYTGARGDADRVIAIIDPIADTTTDGVRVQLARALIVRARVLGRDRRTMTRACADVARAAQTFAALPTPSMSADDRARLTQARNELTACAMLSR